MKNTEMSKSQKASQSILNLPQFTSINLNLPQMSKTSIVSIKKDKSKCNCKYCNTEISAKNKIRHYITSCLDIPDKIKIKLIDKHNNNSRTKEKIDLLDSSLIKTNKKITNNNIMNNNINNNNITNNNIFLNVNSIGNESIEHITIQGMVHIMKSGHRMIKEFCKEIHKVKENKNAFLDVRNKTIYYINENKEIELEDMNDMLGIIVDKYVKKINEFFKSHLDSLDNVTKLLFKETLDTFFCVINLNNYDEKDIIENENKIMLEQFNNDMRFSLYKIKDFCAFIKDNKLLL